MKTRTPLVEVYHARDLSRAFRELSEIEIGLLFSVLQQEFRNALIGKPQEYGILNIRYDPPGMPISCITINGNLVIVFCNGEYDEYKKMKYQAGRRIEFRSRDESLARKFLEIFEGGVHDLYGQKTAPTRIASKMPAAPLPLAV